MRRNAKFTLKPKHILIICSVALVGLMIFSYFFAEKIAPVKTAFGRVVSPMQSGIDVVGSYISDKTELFNTVRKLTAENKELQERVDTLSSENKILQLDQYELNSLRDLLKLDKTYSEYPKVAARITSEPTDNWYSQFHIDKGSNDGLKAGMNVMAGDGLVGIITETGHNYSIVRTIIDDVSSVSAMFMKTKDSCVVSGSLELLNDGVIKIEDVKKTAKIKTGYEVVTSSASGKYLPGILIGTVESIQTDASKLTQSGHLTPAVDFSKLDTVLVITTLKEEEY